MNIHNAQHYLIYFNNFLVQEKNKEDNSKEKSDTRPEGILWWSSYLVVMLHEKE